MKRRIGILGSTGSIGLQTLEIIRNHLDYFEVVLLACNTSIEKLNSQIKEFSPKFAIISNSEAKLPDNQNTAVFLGEKYLSEKSLLADCDIIVNALSGISGLLPTISALELSKTVATANKESIVVGGALIKKALSNGGSLFPIDSEHSTLWQCLSGGAYSEVSALILTASGGAFRDVPLCDLKNAKAKDALIHPNWKMGDKITIDCATMVNKGLEIIEAENLFGIENVSAVMHKESIVHALVEFNDGAVLAGLSNPDMRIPISLAIFEGERKSFHSLRRLKLEEIKNLTFSSVDFMRFPCYEIALDVKKQKGNAAAVYTFSNDILVNEYLYDNIAFTDFSVYIRKALDKFFNADVLSDIDSIKDIEHKVKEYTKRMILEKK